MTSLEVDSLTLAREEDFVLGALLCVGIAVGMCVDFLAAGVVVGFKVLGGVFTCPFVRGIW